MAEESAAPVEGAPPVAPETPAQAAEEADKPAEAKPPEAPPERRKYKLKVDGAELEEELTDEEIGVRLQKARAADKRFQEAAEERKRIERAVELIKRDPVAALKDPFFNVDVRKLVEEQLVAEYQRHLLPPEQQRLMDLEAQLKSHQAREAHQQQQQQATEAQVKDAAMAKQVEAEVLEAWKLADGQKDISLVADMATLQMLALENGYALSPQQLATEAKARRAEADVKAEARWAGGLKGLKGEELVKRLGDEVVKEVLRHSVMAAKGGRPTSAPPPQVEVDEKPKARRTLNESEFKRVVGLK